MQELNVIVLRSPEEQALGVLPWLKRMKPFGA